MNEKVREKHQPRELERERGGERLSLNDRMPYI